MITFPCAKINLGLNIVEQRADGYHNIETVFYPIPLCDALEIKQMHVQFPSAQSCDLKVTGNAVDCNESDNLVIKAYQLLAKDFDIPRIHAHLYKRIPSQAGLGGGSSDAAYMIRLLDERFRLNLGNAEMERYAAQLGADCAFFITSEPSFATGIGNHLSPVDTPRNNLGGYHLYSEALHRHFNQRGLRKRHSAQTCKMLQRDCKATYRNLETRTAKRFRSTTVRPAPHSQ